MPKADLITIHGAGSYWEKGKWHLFPNGEERINAIAQHPAYKKCDFVCHGDGYGTHAQYLHKEFGVPYSRITREFGNSAFAHILILRDKYVLGEGYTRIWQAIDEWERGRVEHVTNILFSRKIALNASPSLQLNYLYATDKRMQEIVQSDIKREVWASKTDSIRLLLPEKLATSFLLEHSLAFVDEFYKTAKNIPQKARIKL